MCEHLLGELRLAPLLPPGSPASASSGFLQPHLRVFLDHGRKGLVP